jgi:TRAP-type mannitol/chloroaromatic compound transport system permease small subunit
MKARLIAAIIGSSAFCATYVSVAIFVLAAVVMSDCALSDAAIKAGETCEPLADYLFWPLSAILTITFAIIVLLSLPKLARWVRGGGRSST